MKNTMNIFRASAANSSLPISKTYVAAAQLINIGCGPEYVSDTIDYRSTSSATAFDMPMALVITLSALLMIVLN
jgi:peptidoglycan biosynthesis protein MviN/MurJ (putative lipid II flippase)